MLFRIRFFLLLFSDSHIKLTDTAVNINTASTVSYRFIINLSAIIARSAKTC